MTTYTSLSKLCIYRKGKLMSKIINRMLKEGDSRLFCLVRDGKVADHEKTKFHSFYYPCGSEGYLQPISDWGYNNAISGNDSKAVLYGLMKSDEFVDGIGVDVSAYLKGNGFSFDGRDIKKKTEKGSISGHSYSQSWQTLTWNVIEQVEAVWEDGEIFEHQREIVLEVTNADPAFLLVLDKLLSMDPILDLGLEIGRSYKIRYQGGDVGLMDVYTSFISGSNIIAYSKLFEKIEEIR